MATESYEAAIKGLNDLLRYDQTFSLFWFKRTETIIRLYRVCRPHSHLHRSTVLFFWSVNLHYMNPSSVWLFFWIILELQKVWRWIGGKKVFFDFLFWVCVWFAWPPDIWDSVRVRLILAVDHAFTVFYLFALYFYAFAFSPYLGSTKADLGNVAAEKIKVLTQELKELDSSNNDAVERIKSGFTHFKTEKYLWVFFLFIIALLFEEN